MHSKRRRWLSTSLHTYRYFYLHFTHLVKLNPNGNIYVPAWFTESSLVMILSRPSGYAWIDSDDPTNMFVFTKYHSLTIQFTIRKVYVWVAWDFTDVKGLLGQVNTAATFLYKTQQNVIYRFPNNQQFPS